MHLPSLNQHVANGSWINMLLISLESKPQVCRRPSQQDLMPSSLPTLNFALQIHCYTSLQSRVAIAGVQAHSIFSIATKVQPYHKTCICMKQQGKNCSLQQETHPYWSCIKALLHQAKWTINLVLLKVLHIFKSNHKSCIRLKSWLIQQAMEPVQCNKNNSPNYGNTWSSQGKYTMLALLQQPTPHPDVTHFAFPKTCKQLHNINLNGFWKYSTPTYNACCSGSITASCSFVRLNQTCKPTMHHIPQTWPNIFGKAVHLVT